MATIEQTIVTQALANLNDISIANGYSFNVSGNVFEWKASLFEEVDDLPAINLEDYGDKIADNDDQLHGLKLYVQIADVGDNSPASIRQKKQDVLTALSLLANENYVASVEYNGSEKESQKFARRMTQVSMFFTIWYYAPDYEI